jgi:hypothetical protein
MWKSTIRQADRLATVREYVCGFRRNFIARHATVFRYCSRAGLRPKAIPSVGSIGKTQSLQWKPKFIPVSALRRFVRLTQFDPICRT